MTTHDVLRLTSSYLPDKSRLHLSLANRALHSSAYPDLLLDNLRRHKAIVEGEVLAFDNNDGTCALKHAIDYEKLPLFDKCLQVMDAEGLQTDAGFYLVLADLMKLCAWAGSTECIRRLHRTFHDATRVAAEEYYADLYEGAAWRDNIDLAKALAKAFDSDGPFQKLFPCRRFPTLYDVNSASMARVLLSKGASAREDGLEGGVLHSQCKRLQTSAALIEVLVREGGASVDSMERVWQYVPEHFPNETCVLYTPLDYACLNLNVEAARALLRCGAKVEGAYAARSQHEPELSPKELEGLEPCIQPPLSRLFDQEIGAIQECAWKHHIDKTQKWRFSRHDLRWFEPYNSTLSIWDLDDGCRCRTGEGDTSSTGVWLRLIKAFADRLATMTGILLDHGAGVHLSIPDGSGSKRNTAPTANFSENTRQRHMRTSFE
ncbi:hypothetical protein F4780DRAFT_703850 [Xylariomycetidae sp. FL0641]|nr:hypothetical protein F4780DRAFT_703850 [Xylariomycetidae sp. FL0641]